MRPVVSAIISLLVLSACGGGGSGSSTVSGIETPAAVQAVSAN